MKLFGTDGVRGKAGEFLDVITVVKLAQAAGIHFRKHSTTNKILVGKDTRRSGYMIENALVSGLTSVAKSPSSESSSILLFSSISSRTFMYSFAFLTIGSIKPLYRDWETDRKSVV